jgi:hypothetical protein
MEPGLWELLARLQPKYRLKYVWEKAKGTFVCAESDPAEEENQASIPTGHNGCGHKRLGEDDDAKKKKAGIKRYFDSQLITILMLSLLVIAGRTRQTCNR